MDLMDSLYDHIAAEIPFLKLGYLGLEESLVMYPLPGSQTIVQFQDGTSDERLLYEIAYKSKSQQKIVDTMWQLTELLSHTDSLNGQGNTFEFISLQVTNLPFLNNLDQQGYYTYLLDFSVEATILEKENVK